MEQKRIKRVFTNSDQVLHIWANQSQDSARCGNVFFEGTKAYSYGYHYELGRLVTYNGTDIALINESGYSITTSKHIYKAKSAASHLVVIGYKEFYDNIKTTVREALLVEQSGLIDELMGHFSRAKFRNWANERKYVCSYLSDRVLEFNQKCHQLSHSEYSLNPDATYIEFYKEHVENGLKFNFQRT
jgi:hypothetical protein